MSRKPGDKDFKETAAYAMQYNVFNPDRPRTPEHLRRFRKCVIERRKKFFARK